MAVSSRSALWDHGYDESVEVNQRALIDKVLARYSGEFTVFRELLQNSDDAQSNNVEIRFETEDYQSKKREGVDGVKNDHISQTGVVETLPDLRKSIVHQWIFKNDGIVFRDEDWARLKKIAEGNPDEEKIGAFGVGFYSLFSVTEEPFVTSGGQWMGFYWKDKKDQLYARRGQLPEDDATIWTSFEMPLREPAPVPVPFDFSRFLASSITFMTHITDINVYYNDKCLTNLKKTSGLSKELGLPGGLKSSSQLDVMMIRGLRSTPLRIQARVMRWVYLSGSEKSQPINQPKIAPARHGGFFSSLFSSLTSTPSSHSQSLALSPSTEFSNLLETNETSISLLIFSADVDVRLDKKTAQEIYRSTKKNPPAKMKYELIYTAKDEYDTSIREDKLQPYLTGSIFQGLRADIDGTGSARIFIGHATAQTTGVSGHMAARFIPTVERESIDFMDRNVAVWNKELLYIGGLVCRSAYEFELATIKELWDASAKDVNNMPNKDLQDMLTTRSSYALKFFTFRQSTPSAEVSNLLGSAFFSCSSNKNYFTIMSTQGIRNISDVRLPDSKFDGFLKELPLLPSEISSNVSLMVNALQSRGLIKEITFEDVLGELRSRPLSEQEAVACLTWWINLNSQSDDTRLFAVRTQFLDATIIRIEGKVEKILPLTSIKYFYNSKSAISAIPLDGPLPDCLLPIGISSHLSLTSIAHNFPWTELPVLDWLKYITNLPSGHAEVNFDINLSPAWAERVLNLISRSWPNLPAKSKQECVDLLKTITCVPTSNGMHIPEQVYFANANIFHDLPVVTLPSGNAIKGSLERVLQALGVRKHVDLQVIFNRMIKTNEWTIADLTKYLVSVRSTLTQEELSRLRVTVAFPKELSAGDTEPTKRFQAKQLYEPLDVFRQLGLPVIDWGKEHKWKGSSEEAKLLYEIGLQRRPSLSVLINLCADLNSNVQGVALRYLVENIASHYPDYDPSNFQEVAYIPAFKDSKSILGNHKEVFLNPEWATFRFLIANLSIQDAAKLQIKAHPTTAQLVHVLQKSPPESLSQAKEWFNILSGRVHDFSDAELKHLSGINFVPVENKNGVNETRPSLRWLPPYQCYIGGDSNDNFHSKLFVFVNFGTAANAFLMACRAKQEPNVEEVAKILVENPHQFYELAEGPAAFLVELRNIAVNSRQISSATLMRMKKSPVLLGLQRKTRGEAFKNDIDYEEDERDIIYDLRKPNQIIIADDTLAYQAFGDTLFTAPQENILEGFYAELGSRRLSSLVKEEYTTSAEMTNHQLATETRALVLERLPLFLHEHTHARTKVSYSWLTLPENFTVQVFGKILVTKTFAYDSIHLSRKQDASAVSKRLGSGPIRMWLAANSQVDLYEIATSLNRILFDSPKTNDALLLMTILSTDLKALKRRGYDVDRILRQQKLEREGHALAQVGENISLASGPKIKLDSTGSSPGRLPERNEPVSIPELPYVPPSIPHAVSTPLQNLKKKIGSFGLGGRRSSENNSNSKLIQSSISMPPTGGPHPVLPPIRSSGSNVTPLDNIAKNIDVAVKACRSEAGNVLQNREHMQQVKESLDEGYCDISGRVGDLKYIMAMGDVKIYVSKEVPPTQEFMATKHDPLARFVHIITRMAQIYEIPLTNLHIFYDLEGGLIAFNRSGSIFLNLRYYEAWHDADVLRGKLDTAYVSWFFTFAHEIAHNLVHQHNSEHEFYFSAICEKYIMELGLLLGSKEAVRS